MISEKKLYEVLGQKLRFLREQVGQGAARLTQADLAEKVGLERTSITNIEKGAQKVPLHVLYKMCESLKVNINEVLPSIDDIQETHTVTPDKKMVTFGQSTANMLPSMREALREVLPQSTQI